MIIAFLITINLTCRPYLSIATSAFGLKNNIHLYKYRKKALSVKYVIKRDVKHLILKNTCGD